MPPKYLFDLTQIDFDAAIANQDEIRLCNPQRGDMEHLNSIIWAEPESGRIVGSKEVKADEFWVSGHIPGRPLFPGVLMIEASAQLASYYTKKYMKWEGFIGFGGVEECRFRLPVVPPAKMYILAQKIWERHGRVHCLTQGIVNSQIVYEAGVTGTRF
jgi:3-hydroxyacyl-[acyl-carrier-protein] dehydratase